LTSKTKYREDTDSTQVLRRKGEKNFEKRVKRALNCQKRNLIREVRRLFVTRRSQSLTKDWQNQVSIEIYSITIDQLITWRGEDVFSWRLRLRLNSQLNSLNLSQTTVINNYKNPCWLPSGWPQESRG
jgi:hypothetical protein